MKVWSDRSITEVFQAMSGIAAIMLSKDQIVRGPCLTFGREPVTLATPSVVQGAAVAAYSAGYTPT